MWPKVSEIMQREVFSVRPNMTIGDVAKALEDEDIHGAPVVNEAGKPIGVVSRTDIVRALLEEEEVENSEINTPNPYFGMESLDDYDFSDFWPAKEEHPNFSSPVREIMSDRVVQADMNVSLGKIGRIMLDEGVHRVLITNNSELVGIVSMSDLIRIMVEQEKD